MVPGSASEELLELVEGLRQHLEALPTPTSAVPAGDGEVVPSQVLASAVELMGVAAEELRVTEEALHAEQEKLRRTQHAHRAEDRRRTAVWDALPVPVLVTDVSGALLEGNGEAAALLGVDADALQRTPLARYLPLEDRRAVRDALSDVVRGVPAARAAVRLGPTGRPGTVVALLGLPDRRADDGGTVHRVRWLVFPRPSAAPEGRPSGADWLTATAALLDAGSAADTEHLLRRIVVQVTRVIPGSDGAALAIGPPGDVTAFAAHGSLALAGDGAQAAAGEGPTAEAYRTGRPCHAADLRADGRWPRLTRAVTRGGARDVLAVPITTPDGATAGVLTVYADAAGSLARSAVELSTWLAAVAGTLLRATAEHERLLGVAEQLGRALDTRGLIEQARGIVMATCSVDADEALGILRRASSTGNRRMADIAREVIDTRGGVIG